MKQSSYVGFWSVYTGFLRSSGERILGVKMKGPE